MNDEYKKWLKFISYGVSDLCDHNVKIMLPRQKMIYVPNEGVQVNGFWSDIDDYHLIFACATGKPIQKWGPIFVHEFCHFLQWKDKEQIWYDYQTISVEDSYKVYHNLPISEELLNFCLDTTLKIELDCEKRVVQLIKKHKLPVNIPDYIKRANSYLHFYNHIKKYRQWYPPGKMPYTIRKLKDVSSSRFYDDYSTIPSEMEYLYKKYYPSKRKNNIIIT